MSRAFLHSVKRGNKMSKLKLAVLGTLYTGGLCLGFGGTLFFSDERHEMVEEKSARQSFVEVRKH